MTTTENIRKELQALVDAKYKEFHSSLLPGANNILGVRIPQLRIMTKEIIKKEDWRTFVESTDTNYYEETMLQGMIIGLAKMELEERMNYVTMFIPRIDNWAVCDIFCSELKTAVKKGKETVWQFIQPYLKSSKEFEIRFGIVMLFHYVDDEHIDSLLEYADLFNHDAYYARMGMAWMLSLCFIKFPQSTAKNNRVFPGRQGYQRYTSEYEKTIKTKHGEHPAISIPFTVLLILSIDTTSIFAPIYFLFVIRRNTNSSSPFSFCFCASVVSGGCNAAIFYKSSSHSSMQQRQR